MLSLWPQIRHHLEEIFLQPFADAGSDGGFMFGTALPPHVKLLGDAALGSAVQYRHPKALQMPWGRAT